LGRRILANILALGGAQLVTMATGVITAIVLARALGPAVYGVLGFGVAVLSYFGLLVNMGMDVHGVREIAKRPAEGRRLVHMILSTRLAFAIVLFGVLVLAIPHFGRTPEIRDVLIIQGVGLFAVALTVDFFYQAEQRMGVAALRQGAAAVAGAIAVVLLIYGPDDLRLAAAVPVAVHIASAVVLLGYFWATRRGGGGAVGEIGRLQFVRRAAPVALMGVLMTIYINMDIIILGYMVPEAEVGFYVAASRVVMIAVVLPNLIHSAFLPALSQAHGDAEAAAAAARNHACAVGFFGGAVGGAGMLLSPAIIQVLFGPNYAGAEGALTILMAHVMAFHLTAAYGTPLLAWQCDKPYTVILGVGALVNVALNFALIPRFGIVGAAAATVATQVLIWIALMALAKKAYGLNHPGLMARILAITAVAMAALWAVMKLFPGDACPWLQLISGGVIYLAVYAALGIGAGVILPSELRRLLQPKA
jgi:O-antigen/teichoic acid export membrane protein